jgi:hypothetical protein
MHGDKFSCSIAVWVERKRSILFISLLYHFLCRFEGISGVEVYQSLRIPDPGLRERREIDLVILTKRYSYY